MSKARNYYLLGSGYTLVGFIVFFVTIARVFKMMDLSHVDLVLYDKANSATSWVFTGLIVTVIAIVFALYFSIQAARESAKTPTPSIK